MKFFLSAVLLMLNTGLFAQDSIPPFTQLSMELFQYLRHKDYHSIEKNMISLKELAQLLNPLLKDMTKEKDSAFIIDTSNAALNSVSYSSEKIDSVYARAKQLEINWDKVIFISISSDSTADKYMLTEYGVVQAQCTIKFSEGENIYGIEYGLRFINKQWKIEEIHPYIVVYKKDGTIEGVMRQDGYDSDMDGYNHPAKKYIKKNS